MKIPFKPSMLKVRHTAVRFIILHHTICQYPAPESRIDNSKYQLPGIFNGVMEQKTGDINYHFIVDKIKEDYIPLTCRPFVTLCNFEDIDPNIDKYSIHIAMMGSYDFKIPEKRLYEVLAYRLLNPLLKMYHLNPNRIKSHKEVSSNKELTCPGDFLDKDIVIAMTRRFVLK